MLQPHGAAPHQAPHAYHLVDPSPWPILGATGAFLLAFGAVFYMTPNVFGSGLGGLFRSLGLINILPGLAIVIFTMYVWWRDVVNEATFQGHHTPVVQLGLRYGMALFIASEVMFFVAWFWGFFNASLYPTAAMGGVWPPKGITTFDPLDLPWLNTLLLLTSGFTVTWAHHDIVEGKKDHAILMLGLTILLGLSFTGVQAWEYSHAPFAFRGGIYPTVFFMATGFHGAHVIIGSLFLIVCWFRLRAGHFKPNHHFGFEAAAWYWHFVDVVWLFLYTCIYWWGSCAMSDAC